MSELANPVIQSMPQFMRIAESNKLVKWDEESQFAQQALEKNKTLANCFPATIQNSIINVAAVGLTLNPADGYAYLVPEYNKETKRNECQLRISFKGLIKAATDTGVIEWVRAEIMREADTFEFHGVDQRPTHNMHPFNDRGPALGVYCVAKLKSGDYMTEVMAWDEVEKIRACAKTQVVWAAWPMEMAKKAVIKRAAKQWPKSDGSSVLHKTIEVINDVEGSKDPMAEMERVADEMLGLIEQEDLMGVGQLWTESTEDEQRILWTAKTKGGWFTKDEKDFIRAAAQGYKKACAQAEEAA